MVVIKECPEMCGVCTTTCVDKNETCAAWAKKGECTGNNSNTVLHTCPQSCGICHTIDKEEL
jgi:hypothetical protein